MSLGAAKIRSTQGGSIYHTFVGVGTGSDMTIEEGPGIALSRTGAGDYLLTWDENPGTFRGVIGWALLADDPLTVEGHTVTLGTYDASAFTMQITINDAGELPADLATTERLSLTVSFSDGSYSGA